MPATDNVVRAQVVLNKKSGLVRDAVTNTWHFNAGGSVSAADLTAIGDQLVNFYSAINAYLSNTLSLVANAHVIKLTDLGDYDAPPNPESPQGPPDVNRTWTLVGSGAASLPTEVAATLTLEAGSRSVSEEVGSTRPAARRRGRIFIGPLTTSVISAQATTQEPLLSDAFRTAVLDAAVAMSTALAALTNPVAVGVLSKANNAVHNVVNYSMDNAFDTIRSRGNRASNRVRSAAIVVAPAA